ncbi:MAG: EthD family reductase [Bacteroidia bacterium]|nr:EthD family reductase [Bacteroidia bacterium]
MKSLYILIPLILAFASLPILAVIAQSQQNYYKVTAFCHKKAEMSQQEFIDYVKDIHVPLVLQMPGLRGYVQNFVSPEAENPPYDLYVELWFDSPEAMQESYASEAGKAAIADVPNCINGAPVITAVDQVTFAEPVVSQGFQSHLKMTFIAHKHPDLNWEAYQLLQLKQYAPKVLNGIPGIKGYEINFAEDDKPENPASAVVHVWFENEDAMKKGFDSPVMSTLKEYQKTMLKEPSVGSLILEYVVVTPPTYLQNKQGSTRK